AVGQEGKTLDDPEDLRILAHVLDLQRTPEHRKRAIEVIESLTAKNVGRFEDWLFLAALYESSGNWPKARETYQELDKQSKNPGDAPSLSRRWSYLVKFGESLLRHHRTGEDQDLNEAQELADELKKLQPNGLTGLILEAEVEWARGHLDKGDSMVQAYA